MELEGKNCKWEEMEEETDERGGDGRSDKWERRVSRGKESVKKMGRQEGTDKGGKGKSDREGKS